MRFIKPMNLNEKSFIMDVRLPEERAVEELGLPHVNQDLETLNPLEFVKENHIEKNDTINILCSSGGRASQAAELFEKAGFNNVAVIIGGLVEAEYEGLPIIRH